MKLVVASSLLFISALSNASIQNSVVVMDEPVVFVRAGQQDNGVAQIEQLFTNVTRGVGGNDAPGFVGYGRSFAPAPGAAGGVPSIASAFPNGGGEVTLPLPPSGKPIPPLVPPVIGPKPPIPPVTPPVPEPETYALMALGILGLLLNKKKKV